MRQIVWEGLAFESIEEMNQAYELLKENGFKVKSGSFHHHLCEAEILSRLDDSEFDGMTDDQIESTIEDMIELLYSDSRIDEAFSTCAYDAIAQLLMEEDIDDEEEYELEEDMD